MVPFVLDHLWQSTLLALALGLATLAFRRASAGVRHGLWFAASAKFLIPFAALAALGRLAGPAIPLPAEARPEAALIERAAQPFSQAALPRTMPADVPVVHRADLQAPLSPAPSAAPLAHPDPVVATVRAAPHFDLGLILLAVWALGSAAILGLWARRWVRLRQVVRSARPAGWPAPMPVLAAPSLVEPGLVGLWRPVLLVPETLPGALPRSGVDAIVAHEAAHLRRRDNLTAALHMLVEALFWFHPLVWWIGGRLIAEREAACDEAVLAAGHDRAIYARSLVESCRLYLQSPLDCVAGASGSDLKSRVEAIMTARPASPLSRSAKALLLAAGTFAFATPVMAGLLTTPEGQTVVARAAAVASRVAPKLIAPVPNPASVADDIQPAKPVVLAQNQSVLTPNLSVAQFDAAAGPLVQDVAAPRIDQPSPSVEAAPTPAPAEPMSRIDPKAQAASFVDFYASTDRHVLARWMAPVCVRVIGLPDDQANTVQRRVVAVAKAVGVRAQPEGCKNPNVQIGFAPDPQNLLDGIAARTPDALGDWSSGTRDHKSIMLPIQAWYETNAGTVADNGTSRSSGLKVRVLYQAPPGPGSFTQSPSVDTGAPVPGGAWWGDDPGGRRNLQSGRFPSRSTTPRATRRAFENALVLVDTRRTGGKSLGVVSDYVALLALSQPGDLGRCNVLPSVTDLFANCPGRAAPDGLTPADAAFLTALYAAKTDKTGDEQADIAARMASILSADAEAAPARAVKPASAVAPVAPSRQSLTPVATRAGDANPQVAAFVQSYGEAFWNQDKWICVRVEGLPSDKAAAVKARVEADARAVGVSVGRAECGLRNEVEIRFAADAGRAVEGVLDYYHHPFWPFPLERPTGADRPIKAWYGMVYDFAGGAGGRGLGAHPNARQKLALAIVVVDPARTQGLSLDTVSDYAAMLALSQPRSLDRCNVLPSITDLYAGACPGRPAPTGLTAADTAFLTALYRGSPGIRATRSPAELVEGVAKRLGGAGAVQPAVAPAAAPRLRLTPISMTTRPAGPRPEVSAFVQSFANTLWNQDAICIRAEGGDPGRAAQVQARVEADARAAGVGVTRNACETYQVEIRFAPDAARAVHDVLADRKLPRSWPYPIQPPSGAGSPIRAWYEVVDDLTHANHPSQWAPGAQTGMEPQIVEAAPYGHKKLGLAIVVVDPARTRDLSPDAIADYVTMLALSQPRSLDRCSVLPSVTDLYAGACAGRPAPTGLTAADVAYLEALYAGNPELRAAHYRSDLVDGMAKRLAGDRIAAR